MHDMVMRLDDMGRPAWIALMVVSFILFWPLGLAVLAFLLWSGRMGRGCGWDRGRWQQRFADRWERRMGEPMGGAWGGFGGGSRGSPWQGASSGNRAFDEYREETLKRLEDEQREFRGFLDRLRMAKDRSEFDQFMTERKSRPSGPSDEPPTPAPQS